MIIRKTWQFRQIDAERASVKPLKTYIVRAEFNDSQVSLAAARDEAKLELATKLNVPFSRLEFLSGTNDWPEFVRV